MAKKALKEVINDDTGEVTEVSADTLARETMTGDLRDVLLDYLKHDKNPLPWNMQGETAQREIIERVTKAVSFAVECAVTIIAADGRQTVKGTLDKVTIKDGIKAEISLSRHNPQRHLITDAQGNVVLLVIASSTPYEGEKKAALPELDQKSMLDDEETDSE